MAFIKSIEEFINDLKYQVYSNLCTYFIQKVPLSPNFGTLNQNFLNLQHDQNFVEPEQAVSWSKYPNEAFFIRKFENDSRKTGRQMRLEETEIFKLSLSPPEPCLKHSQGYL